MNTRVLTSLSRVVVFFILGISALVFSQRAHAQAGTQYLLNLNFGGGIRTNIAATGHWTNDVWNIIPAATNVVTTYTPSWGPPDIVTLSYTAQTNLLWADGSASAVTVSVTNLFTTNYNSWSDVMLDSYLYAPNVLVEDWYYDDCLMDYVYVYVQSEPKVQISNLPTNTYDVYLYGITGYAPGVYRLKVGTGSWSSSKAINFNEYGLPDTWLEPYQFVKFTNIVVGSGENLLVDVQQGYEGHLINGIQIIQAGGKPLGPEISPVGGTYTNTVTVTITNTAPGTTNFYRIDSGAWTLYVGSFILYDDAVIYAKSYYPGGTESHTVSRNYVFPDNDGDGLSDAYEYLLGTNPQSVDSDYDGRTDGQEIADETDPTSASSVVGVRLARWKFSNTSWLSEAGNGPQFHTNLNNVASYDGNGLLMNTNVAARLKYRDEELDLNPNINLRNGTVSLWFKPDWGSTNAGGTGPGVWSRLIEVGDYSIDATYGQWVLGLNPEGTQILFSTQAGGSETNHITASVSIGSNTWHQVVLTFTSTNAVLYLDGLAITNGPGVTFYPSATVRADDGIHVGGDRDGGNLAKGMFDDLETYNYPISDDDVWASFEAVASRDSDGDGVSDLDEHEQGTSITTSNLPLTIIITQPRPGSIIP